MREEVVAEVAQGRLRGRPMTDYRGGAFCGFLGVPFARAPVGELRFKAAEPPEPWKGTLNATKEGPECPSLDMYFAYHVGQEDNCLNLNIYTKELPKDGNFKKKPVMVWIYGGAFMYGSNKLELYAPDYLMTQDIVLVCPNYRVGVFGFLSLKDPSLEVPGNVGLKDQVMALKWIKTNIEKFGGDPNNVTIFGESAGAASVHYLTLSPLTKGLFHKAIAQSGSALNSWAWGRNNALDIGKAMGYRETDEKSILDKLKKESSRSIVSGQFKVEDVFEAATVRPFGPVVEPPSKDAFITKSPQEILRAGEQHQIPIIMGYNSLEGIFFELVRKTRFVKLPTTFEKDIPFDLGVDPKSDLSKQLANKMKKFYFGNEECTEENIKRLYMLKGDVNFLHKIQKCAEILQETSTQPVYLYRMSLNGSLNFFKKFSQLKYFKSSFFLSFLTKLSSSYAPPLKHVTQYLRSKMPEKPIDGVCHADDLYYIFKGYFSPKIEIGSKEDLQIQRFVKLWTNFAKYGDPTPEKDEILGEVRWDRVKSKKLDIFDIGEELKMVGNEDDEERTKFWDEIYRVYKK